MVKVKEADLVWSQICSSLLHSLIQEAFVASVLCWYCTQFWGWRAAAAVKLLQSCLTLCNPTDDSPPGSPVPAILQARILEWVAISFSNAWKWKVKSESEATQSCLTLCDPVDCILPGSSIHGIFQARVLEWVAISFSRGWRDWLPKAHRCCWKGQYRVLIMQ